jgi:hypothetical protein
MTRIGEGEVERRERTVVLLQAAVPASAAVSAIRFQAAQIGGFQKSPICV